ncbi:unnamed protein product [Cladocopium goreaui]|uniref:Vegetative incompatibility protein HET-E-1 n=1 Tax=Cladocopium goreaui TaxID=2562237 RepID=A0A9P1C144_9DINO|nr:unnamed protein product [Cladocopium goreaui]
MSADCVDLPQTAGTCDTSQLLPPDLARCIMDPEQIFPSGFLACAPAGPEGANRDEYIKLVHRQLQCGKIRLRRQCRAVGDVFCVAKSTPGKQREVWNGSQAGVAEDAFMSLDSPPPSGVEACGVATDDTFFFHKDKQAGAERLRRLDKVFEERGMPKNQAKDVTLQPAMTALGCELTTQPPAAEPASSKLVRLFAALLDLFLQGQVSPSGLNRALGVEQWFCLLNRPMFSVFSAVCDFVRREPPESIQFLPEDVQSEILVAAAFAPLLGADLGRDFLPQLIACDAAGTHGFGVSYMPCSQQLVRSVSSLSERRGDFVRFFQEPDEPCRKDRLGTPHELPFHKWQFHTAISAKARWKAHAGLLEAHGLHIALKWALRSAVRFHRRVVVLIDAKAILGAASKGRSSAPGIRGVLRKIGNLLMATNSLLRFVYIPSEDNPADAPSRGIVRRVRNRSRKGLNVPG